MNRRAFLGMVGSALFLGRTLAAKVLTATTVRRVRALAAVPGVPAVVLAACGSETAAPASACHAFRRGSPACLCCNGHRSPYRDDDHRSPDYSKITSAGLARRWFVRQSAEGIYAYRAVRLRAATMLVLAVAVPEHGPATKYGRSMPCGRPRVAHSSGAIAVVCRLGSVRTGTDLARLYAGRQAQRPAQLLGTAVYRLAWRLRELVLHFHVRTSVGDRLRHDISESADGRQPRLEFWSVARARDASLHPGQSHLGRRMDLQASDD